MIRVAKEQWFYLLLPILLVVGYWVARSPEGLADPLFTERMLLIDALISVPLLYWLFLRSRVPARAALIRCGGLALAMLWFAAWLLQGEGQIIPWLGWLRTIALPLIIVIEGAALIAVVRYTFSADPKEEELVSRGVPPLFVKLMLAEARFWKRVWRFLSGR